MKKQIRHNLIILLTLAISLPFSSCENDYDYEDYFDYGFIESIFERHHYDVDKTWRLCTRSWLYSYYDRHGNFLEEVVYFNKERIGKIEYYTNGRINNIKYFDWNWDNYNQTRIFVRYPGGEYDRLDDVRVTDYDLSFIANGIEFYYEAEY